MNAPAPIATGDLASRSFAKVVAHLYQHELSGTLVLWPDGDGPQHRIAFVRGWIAGGRVEPSSTLDRVLLDLLARGRGAYALYAENLLGSENVLVQRLDPLRVLAAGARGSIPEREASAGLEALGDTHLRVRGGVDWKRYELLAKEHAFLDVLRSGPQSAASLIGQCELGQAAARRLLYVWWITQGIERYEAPLRTSKPEGVGRPSAPEFAELPLPAEPERVSRTSIPNERRSAPTLTALPAPPPPPNSLAPEALAFWQEVTERTASVERQTYFAMLDVTQDATPEVIRKAYLGLAKRWHPDRAAGPLAPLRPFVEPIFAILTQAHDTLVDTDRRARYTKLVAEGGGTPETDRKVEAILWATHEQQKAEVMLKRREIDAAVEVLRKAAEAAPDEPDVLAAYAAAIFQLAPTAEREAQIGDLARRAIALAPRNDRAHFTLGASHARQGHEADATKHFKLAAEANPKNLDASREVRLRAMRGGTPTKRPDAPIPEKTGLFSKLFPGKKS